MAQTEDTELRDLVIEALEKNGSLAKIRALLRANVFLVFEDEIENIKQNASLDSVLKLPEGAICLSIIHEFLEFCNLKNTLFVYMAESRQRKEYVYEGQKKLSETFNLPRQENAKEPILVQLLRQVHSNSKKYFDHNDSQKLHQNAFKDDQNCTYIVHEDSSNSASSNSQSDNSSDEKNKLHLRLPLDNSDTDTSSDSAREKSSSEYIPSQHIICDNLPQINENDFFQQTDNKKESTINFDLIQNSTNVLQDLKLINNNASSDSTSYRELQSYKPLGESLIGKRTDSSHELNENDVTDSVSNNKSDTKSNIVQQPLQLIEEKIEPLYSETLSSASLKNEEIEGQIHSDKTSLEESGKTGKDTGDYSNDFMPSPVKQNKDDSNKSPRTPESLQEDQGAITMDTKNSSFDNQHHSSPSSQSSISISDVADLISEKSLSGYHKNKNKSLEINNKSSSYSKKKSCVDKSRSDDSGDFSESPIPSLSNLSLDIHSD